MAVAIIRKALEDQDKPGSGPPSYIPNLDKFLLKAFNRLSHNREVSGLWIAEYLLDLPDQYISDVSIKLMNISVLKNKFRLLISGQNFNTTNDIARVNVDKVTPYSIFEYYFH